MILRKVILGLCLCSIFSALFGQGINSSVEGLVTDQTGGVVPGAEVALINLRTSRELTTLTNDRGRYMFPSVPVGRYSLKVTLPGFKTFLESDFQVVVAQRADMDVVLEVGERTETVKVEARGLTAGLDTSSNELGTLIDTQMVEQLPLNGREFLQLGILSGATQSSAGGSGTNIATIQTGRSGRAINISGLQQDLISYKINGMSVTGSRMGHLEQSVSIAAVDQFKVRHGFFLSGEGTGASVVSVATKAGTNEFHGEVFEFLRNDNLDARNFFSTAPPGEFKRNQFGFALGGPIVRERIFFFANYEGLRRRRADEARAFAATQAMFGGDLSEVATPIYNPHTFDPATGKRAAFPNNQIPSNLINPVAQNLRAFYLPGSSFNQRPFNLFRNTSDTHDSDQFGIRIDAQLNSWNQIFGQFTHEDSKRVRGGLQPSTGREWPLESQLAMIQWTSTWSPALVNSFRIGWTRGLVYQRGETLPGIQNELGITGTGNPDGVPLITLQGIGSFGSALGNVGNVDNLYQLHEGGSYLRGDHHFQFGADLRWAWPSVQENANASARGRITFDSLYTTQLERDAQGRLTRVDNTGNSFADFLLGMPSVARTLFLPRMHYRWTHFEPYFRHSWKIRPDLTLNWSLSWMLVTPPKPYLSPDKDLPHAFDFATGKILAAALGDIPVTVYETDKNDWAPRLGLAWRIGEKTTLRSGFGIYPVSPRIVTSAIFAVLGPGSQATRVVNSPFEPFPTYELGQNVLPPVTIAPLTREFLDDYRGALFALDQGWRTGYVEQWTLAIQRELGRGQVLEVAYFGNQAHKLNSQWDANDCSVPDSLACDLSAIPYPQFRSGITFLANAANSSYHALNVKFNRQYTQGLNFLTNYTWSKALGNGLATTSALHQRREGRRLDRGPAAYDIPHRLVVSALWELPFGENKPFLSDAPPFLRHVVADWSITAIGNFATGTPITVTAPNRTGYPARGVRANRLRDDIRFGPNQDLRKNGFQVIDPSAFESARPGFYGNSGVGVIYGPGVINWDIGIHRDFRVGEDVRIQFRTEFFNAFNHAQFEAGSSSNVVSVNFGKALSARPSREIQFVLKVVW